jgi:flavin reductase (DIM6/NTAB) family NADH-FMN oxidoreductase RutF
VTDFDREPVRRIAAGAASGGLVRPPARAVDRDGFREALGRFASGITVVTTQAGDGIDHAMTANAVTSVSIDPFLLLVCVEKIARFRDAVLESGLWAISVLGESAIEAANWFATRGRPLAGQLVGFPYTRGEATGAALLADALATVECRTTAVHDGGDHDIVVGEVLSVAVPRPDDRPLLYFRGKYHVLGDAT